MPVPNPVRVFDSFFVCVKRIEVFVLHFVWQDREHIGVLRSQSNRCACDVLDVVMFIALLLQFEEHWDVTGATLLHNSRNYNQLCVLFVFEVVKKERNKQEEKKEGKRKDNVRNLAFLAEGKRKEKGRNMEGIHFCFKFGVCARLKHYNITILWTPAELCIPKHQGIFKVFEYIGCA